MNNTTIESSIAPSGIATVVGVDIGGTKTQIRLCSGTTTHDWTISSGQWRNHSDTVDHDDMVRLCGQLTTLLGDNLSNKTRMCIGLHGGDSERQLNDAAKALRAELPCRTIVRNDAELLGPAVGEPDAISLVVGTGSIAVARSKQGTFLRAGGYGYGWLFADFGCAPALVRESIRTLLRIAVCDGERQAMDDPIWPIFAEALDIEDMSDLPLALGGNITETAWGNMAPLVFHALDQRSRVADAVLNDAVEVLCHSVDSLTARGAHSTTVIAAGGVITHQPVLQKRLRQRLADNQDHPYTLRILDAPPVDGAIAIARAMAD